MTNRLDYPGTYRALVLLALSGSSMFVVRSMEFHTETLTGILLYTPAFALIGLGLGIFWVNASCSLRASSPRMKRRIVFRFMLCAVLAAYVGWLLWRPWLWFAS